METSFSRQFRAASSAFLNRVYIFFTTPGAINSQYLIPFLVNPVLLELLQLNYQSQNNTPFETHPISMLVASASFYAYCLAYSASLRISSLQFSSTCLNIVSFCTWCFGQLSLASLAAVLIPNSIAFLPYVVYFVLAVAELLYCVYYRTMGDQLREWLFQGRFGLVALQQSLMSLWRHMVDQLRDWHFPESIGLMQHFFMSLPRRMMNRGVNQRQLLPVYVAPRR